MEGCIEDLSPGDFVIQHKLGTGIFGEVFFAVSKTTGENYALKKISKSNANYNSQMVTREIIAGKNLKNDGIVEFKSYFETYDSIYLVFEYISGRDLCDFMIVRDEPLSEMKTKEIFRQIVESMAHCHKQGIAHRDIKLDNILLTPEGRVKIIDFGLSTGKILYTQMCEDCVGSAEYAAPEILLGGIYNPYKSDVYSCGVVLYCMVFGKFPFSVTSRWDQISIGKHPPLVWTNDGVSEQVKDLLAKLLEIVPEQRPSMNNVLNHPWFSEIQSCSKFSRLFNLKRFRWL